jgi:hypothetical protein
LHWRGAASPLCNEHTLPLTLMRDVQPTNVHSTSERASPPTPAPAGSASVRVGGRYVVRSDLRTADGALARGADVSVHPAVPLCVRIVDGSRCEIATLLSFFCSLIPNINPSSPTSEAVTHPNRLSRPVPFLSQRGLLTLHGSRRALLACCALRCAGGLPHPIGSLPSSRLSRSRAKSKGVLQTHPTPSPPRSFARNHTSSMHLSFFPQTS